MSSVEGVAADGASRTLPSVLLHVVSPSAEAQRLTFPDTLISSTVLDLKRKIQEAVPSRPPPERQRLIYQGKALVRPEMTMEAVLGSETLSTAESFTLHLVLPPESATFSSSSSTIHEPRTNTTQIPGRSSPHAHLGRVPTPFERASFERRRAIEHATAVHTAAANALSAASHGPQGGPQHPGPHHGVPFNPLNHSGVPMHLQNPFDGNNGNGTTNLAQQLGNPFGGNGNVHPFQPPLPGMHVPPGFPGGTNPLLQQPTAPSNAPGSTTSFQSQPGAANQSPNNSHSGTPGIQSPAITATEANRRSETLVREGQIPGGGQWRMVINQTTVPAQGNQNEGSRSNVGANQAGPHAPASAPATGAASSATNLGNMSQFTSRLAMDAAARLQQSMANIGNPSVNQMPSLRNNHLFPPMVYLISSPTGYQALLVPSGNNVMGPGFMNPQTGFHNPMNHFPPTPFGPYSQWPRTPNSNLPHEAQAGEASNRTPQAAAPEQDAAQAPDQAVAQPQQDEAVDLLRILIPFGGHLWLIIRLLGFVYLFAGGASSWWRTIMLATVALVIFFNHVGYLRPIYQAVADPVRRHLEGLLRAEGEQIPRNAGGVAGARRAAGTVPQPARGREGSGGAPTPEAVAERLLHEREQQDVSVVRTSLRRAERAIALFVASLVPGVGEQHIAARTRAEAERAREQQEQQQQQQQQEREAASSGNVAQNERVVPDDDAATAPGAQQQDGGRANGQPSADGAM